MTRWLKATLLYLDRDCPRRDGRAGARCGCAARPAAMATAQGIIASATRWDGPAWTAAPWRVLSRRHRLRQRRRRRGDRARHRRVHRSGRPPSPPPSTVALLLAAAKQPVREPAPAAAGAGDYFGLCRSIELDGARSVSWATAASPGASAGGAALEMTVVATTRSVARGRPRGGARRSTSCWPARRHLGACPADRRHDHLFGAEASRVRRVSSSSTPPAAARRPGGAPRRPRRRPGGWRRSTSPTPNPARSTTRSCTATTSSSPRTSPRPPVPASCASTSTRRQRPAVLPAARHRTSSTPRCGQRVKPTIGIGVIGFGWMGQAAQPLVPAHPDAVPRAHVRAPPGGVRRQRRRRRTSPESFGFAAATDDWRSVIEHPDVEVVVVTAPNMLHEELCVAAARRASTSSARSRSAARRSRPCASPRRRARPASSPVSGTTTAGRRSCSTPAS